ncbi:MAG TPA: hypothetical protein VLE99_05335 [Candidatus Saccharimonadales bacterium]|nr:hypothetical protein [Candidatus Saccharimonadales bacterium]
MSEYRTISAHDTSAHSEILELASGILAVIGQAYAARWPRDSLLTTLNDGTLVGQGRCVEASDAATRAAYCLGIVASRIVAGNTHFHTSFAPLDAMPSEDDLILCMTWAQFVPDLWTNPARLKELQPYFGPRRGMADLVTVWKYRTYFAPDSISFRQTVHRPRRDMPSRHRWLATTPEEVASGRYPIRQVEHETDVSGDWL